MASVFDRVLQAQGAVNQQRSSSLLDQAREQAILQQAAQFPMQQQRLQQQLNSFPLEQKLRDIDLQMGQQKLRQGEAQFSQEQTIMAGNLAEQALKIEDPDMQQTFILGAAQKLGVNIDPAQLTKEDLNRFVDVRDALATPTDQGLTEFQSENLKVQRERLALEEQRIQQANSRLGFQSDEIQRDRLKEEKAALNKKRRAIEKAGLIIDKSNEALEKVGITTAGIGGAIGRIAPGTPAVQLESTVETIKANLGFDQLQELREASPTGGALGQVTEMELSRLESSVENLDPNQGPALLTQNLNSLVKRYEKVRGLLNGTISVPDTKEDYDALESGNFYVDPDDQKLYRKP